MIKTLHCCFCPKPQNSFILNYKGLKEGSSERGLSKWNSGELLKYLNM